MSRYHTRTYSRYVSLMKIILPLGIVLSLGFIVGWPYLISVSKEQLTAIDTTQPEIKENRMVRPHYISTDEKGQPFHLSAEWAKQKTENHADLINPQGSMTMIEGETFNVESKKGHYDSQGKILTLENKVILSSTEGDVIETEKAQVDLNTGNIEGDLPITGEGPTGAIMGQDGFKVEKRPSGKKVLTLKGRSRVVINSGSLKKKKDSHEQ